MHFFDTGKTKFNYNSDLSGMIHIKNEYGEQIEVNGDCLIEFVGNYFRSRAISYIENFDFMTFLNKKGR